MLQLSLATRLAGHKYNILFNNVIKIYKDMFLFFNSNYSLREQIDVNLGGQREHFTLQHH